MGGDKCYDDRPLNIVKDRTRTEAAWQGGCMLPGCIPPDSGSALSLPDGVNVVLYDEFDFKGDHVSINGPLEIPCLALYDADGCRPRGGLGGRELLLGRLPAEIPRVERPDWFDQGAEFDRNGRGGTEGSRPYPRHKLDLSRRP